MTPSDSTTAWSTDLPTDQSPSWKTYQLTYWLIFELKRHWQLSTASQFVHGVKGQWSPPIPGNSQIPIPHIVNIQGKLDRIYNAFLIMLQNAVKMRFFAPFYHGSFKNCSIEMKFYMDEQLGWVGYVHSKFQVSRSMGSLLVCCTILLQGRIHCHQSCAVGQGQ